MKDYLSRFNETIQRYSILSLLPLGVCPFLYYNLGPYLFTLSRGGRFNWVPQKNNLLYRKPVSAGDFMRKDVNRLYPNECLIRCPNPEMNVVAAVGLYFHNTLKIRILQGHAFCRQKYKGGEEIILSKDVILKNILEYNAKFTDILLSSCQTSVQKEDWCLLGEESEIRTCAVFFPCRYQTKKTGTQQKCVPGGFCVHLFQFLYPYILAKMYRADSPDSIEWACPRRDCRATIILQKRYLPGRRVVEFAEKVFQFLFYPVDIINYELDIEIKNIQAEASCRLLHRKGKYSLNLTSKSYMCPAALHSIYPYLITEKYRARLWEHKASCPDCVGSIYSISHQGEKNNG